MITLLRSKCQDGREWRGFFPGFMLMWVYSMAVIGEGFASVQHVHQVHHQMTKRELRHTFDVDNVKEVPPYNLISPSDLQWTNLEAQTSKPVLKLDIFNEHYEIVLSPHDSLLSPDLVSVVRNGSNSRLYHGLPKNSRCHYRGVAISHSNASVALSNCTFMRGSIALDDHFLVLHPMPKRLQQSKNSQSHVIFKRSAALASDGISLGINKRIRRLSSIDSVVEDSANSIEINDQSITEEFCDVKNLDNKTLPFFALRDSETAGFGYGPLTLELALFLDGQLYQHFVEEYGTDRAEQELTDFSLALINNVYLLYRQPTMQPKLNMVIVRYELWKTQPEEIEGSRHKNGEAQLFLDTFCAYQAQLNPGNRALKAGRWDHATLLTGFDIYHTTSSVAGVAPVARMCDPVFSCSLVEGLHLGRSFVLAHEMGHNLGMVHDGVQNQCSRSCCLMSAINGAGKTTWSPCSVRELNAYILSLGNPGQASNCLADGEHVVEVKDHKLKGLPPGQRFSADQQCSFFWGRDFRNEIPSGKKKSEICNILWCGNGGSTISTSHPALEGTWCGPNKWCANGQCGNWPTGSPAPSPIDGAWSQWTSITRSVCSECKISAGVRVRKDIRGCDSPAPNNGGKDCGGSPIRGILCDSYKSKCGDIEKQKFSDDFCTSLKDDGTGKGDAELSGKSFLHSTSPCKIWCHLGDTKLIRNKGFFPDGTPCGIEKYCVDGECLELSCSHKALVFDNVDCPNATATVSESWSAWSSWSSCSVTCGNGSRSRKRHCGNDLGTSCPGVGREQEDCSSPTSCSAFDQWSAWGECSLTCGQGVRVRSRDCKNGADCIGDTIQFEQCNNTACAVNSWSQWTDWSICTKSCGTDSQRSRRRTCQAGDHCVGQSQQTENCPKKECQDSPAGLFSWASWSPCSTTCGSGTQTRSRPCRFNSDPFILVERCVDGQSIDERECNNQPCPGRPFLQEIWSEWSAFGQCSVTCGTGTQSRNRACRSKTSNCGGAASHDEKPCFAPPCPTEAIVATTVPTSRPSVTASTESSGDQTAIFIINSSTWSSWAPWSSCSKTCDGGFRQRVRYCLSHSICPPSGSIQIDNCNIQECDASWQSWQSWSSCSRTCGSDGQRTRTRKCSALESDECSGNRKETGPCEALPPCASATTHSPTVAALPGWSQWSEWSGCSCFNNKSLRRRYCQILQPSVLGFCVGPVLEERHCAPSNCTPVPGGWSKWSDWSLCSTDCISASNANSDGHKIRHRQCSDPFPVNRGPYCFGQSFEKVPCSSLPSCSGSAVDGGWSDWSSWSVCSASCSTGHRSRTRYCTNPAPVNGGKLCQGLDFNLEVCQQPDLCPSPVDGAWGEWQDWSSCTKTCGFAFQSRQRICDSPEPSSSRACDGLSYMTKLCTLAPCPNSIDGHWSPWTSWSECSAQCGYGIRSRSRNCDNPHPTNGGIPCLGASADVVLCTGQENNCDSMEKDTEKLEAVVRQWENNKN